MRKIYLLILGMFLLFNLVSATQCPAGLLYVNTNSPESITIDGATLRGSTSANLNDYSRVYVGFAIKGGEFSSYTNIMSSFRWITLDYSNPYNYVVGGLASDTQYQYKAVMLQYEDDLGDGYSSYCSDLISYSFTTLSDFTPQEIDTLSATSLTTSSAVLNGDIVSMGDSVEVYTSFGYRKEGGSWIYTNGLTGTDPNFYTESFTTASSFNFELTGLESGTTYEFEAFGQGEEGYESGNVLSFTTSEITVTPPTVSTLSATSINENDAQLNMELSSLGDYPQTYVKFFYKKSSSSTWIPIEASETELTATGSYSYTLTGLEDDTNYNFASSYYNSEDFVFYRSNTVNFTTDVTVIIPWIDTIKETVTYEQEYSKLISSLDSNTEYEFRICADTTEVGTTCGEILNFTTLSLSNPTVSTLSVSTKTDTTAVLRGEITNMGDYSSTFVGFVLNDGSGYVSLSYSEEITETGIFSFEVTGLDPDTTYNFRATTFGDNYYIEGNQKDFLTLPISFLPPQENKSISNINLNYSNNITIPFDEYYSYYDYITISLNGNTINENEFLTYEEGNLSIASFNLYSNLNKWYLEITSFEQDFNITVYYNVSNSYDTLEEDFEIIINEEGGSGIIDDDNDTTPSEETYISKLGDFFINIFPDGDDLNNKQKIGIIFITLLISSVLIGIFTYSSMRENSYYLIGGINILWFILFATSGYISTGFLIIFGSLFIFSLVSPFTDIDEEENNWVDTYGATQLTGFVFDFVKYPVTSVVYIFEFLGSPFTENQKEGVVNITISGSGSHEGYTLDGIYNYIGYSRGILCFEHENKDKPQRAIFIDSSTDLSEETFIFNEARLGYSRLIWNTYIYNATGGSGDNLITSWEKINMNYDYNPTATGVWSIDEELINDFSTTTSRIFNFFDTAKEQAKEKIRYLGLIPEVIGIPLLFLLYLMIILGIIKLLPFT